MNDAPRQDAFQATPDSALPGWLSRLPPELAPYASLARADRPVGVWLLALPCWIGLAQARLVSGLQWIDLVWFVLFGIGAAAMRSAGCVWNDIMDREIDAQVARTAARPIPSGQVTVTEAWLFLGCLIAVGALVWLLLPLDAKLTALAALPLVAAYPFMKRITWWPQAWLGLTFNWGVLVAAATAGTITAASVVLYAALVCWTVAYDTIYALQDREDDALIGVKSTARLFGDHAKTASFAFHTVSGALVALSCVIADAPVAGALAGLTFIAHGAWQALRLSAAKEANALAMFKSNVWAGALLVGILGLSALV